MMDMLQLKIVFEIAPTPALTRPTQILQILNPLNLLHLEKQGQNVTNCVAVSRLGSLLTFIH